MCEAGINIKVMQDTLGHKDISTTMNIYTDATKDLKQKEFNTLDMYFKKEQWKTSLFVGLRHLRQNLRQTEQCL